MDIYNYLREQNLSRDELLGVQQYILENKDKLWVYSISAKNNIIQIGLENRTMRIGKTINISGKENLNILKSNIENFKYKSNKPYRFVISNDAHFIPGGNNVAWIYLDNRPYIIDKDIVLDFIDELEENLKYIFY